MKIAVMGMGSLTPWGQSNKAFADSYATLKNACVPNESVGRLSNNEHLKNIQVATLGEFQAKNFMPPANVRKYEIYSRLGIASGRLAIDSLANPLTSSDFEDMAIAVGIESTGAISAEYYKDLVVTGPESCSPRKFPFVSANTSGCHMAMEFGIQGQSMNLGGTFSAGFSAFYCGIKMLQAKRSEHCMVSSIDYLVDVNLMGYSRLGLFKKHPDLALGEGAVTFILQNSSSEVQEGQWGTVLGCHFETQPSKPWLWSSSSEVHQRCLEKATGDHSIDKIFLAQFEGAPYAASENEALDGLKNAYGAGRLALKPLLGESGGFVFLQLLAAFCEPKGTRSLISVVSPAGMHGAILVESQGRSMKEIFV